MSFIKKAAGALRAITYSDAWQNTVSKLGTVYDKLTYHIVGESYWLTEQELENLYYGDWAAQRIIAEPVDMAFRNGWKLKEPVGLDKERANTQADLILRFLKEIKAEENYIEALYWGRLYGRGGLLLGAKDGTDDLTNPLDIERVTELTYVEALSSEEFSAVDYQDDPREAGYGEPETWRITRQGAVGSETEEVHKSRVLLTGAVVTSRKKRNENNWRDASVLQAAFEALRNFSSGITGVAHMMTDSSQAVLKIDGFLEALGEEGPDLFDDRMRILELSRALRIMTIDAASESFEYVERTFTGVHELINKLSSVLSGAAHMPMTILFGESPAGMDATGESDIRGWYDQIDAVRKKKYGPQFKELIVLSAIVTGAEKPLEWSLEWCGLWQETDKEKQDRYKVIADTDASNITHGVYTEDEVAIQRHGGEEYDDGPIRLDEESIEARTALLEQDRERALSGEEDPEDPEAEEETDPEKEEESGASEE